MTILSIILRSTPLRTAILSLALLCCPTVAAISNDMACLVAAFGGHLPGAFTYDLVKKCTDSRILAFGAELVVWYAAGITLYNKVLWPQTPIGRLRATQTATLLIELHGSKSSDPDKIHQLLFQLDDAQEMLIKANAEAPDSAPMRDGYNEEIKHVTELRTTLLRRLATL